MSSDIITKLRTANKSKCMNICMWHSLWTKYFEGAVQIQVILCANASVPMNWWPPLPGGRLAQVAVLAGFTCIGIECVYE